MKMSASSAAGPSLEMLRMKDSGIRMTSCRRTSTVVEKGLRPPQTALKKDSMFSAVKTMPEQTKPICESVMEPRISPRIQSPTISWPMSP